MTKLHLVVLTLSMLVSNSIAQTTSTARAPSNSTKPKNEAELERERVKRNQARSLLTSLATDARTFNDQALRARSLARIADVLWTVDADQGRVLFRKAWEAAETADRESNEKLQEDIRAQRARTGGGYSYTLPPNIRREVLRLAARHDRALSEEFLEKLKAAKQGEVDATKNNTSRLPEALSQRLSLARELLNTGDIEQATQIADPALSTISMETISFLCELREKDANAADSRISALLASAASSQQSDANTVSLLSSYFFSPFQFVTFTRGGTSSSSSRGSTVPPDVAPELRANFFQVAANILLRQLPAGEEDSNGPGLDGKYYVMMEKKMFDQAIDLARKGELTHLQRSWAFTRAAKPLVKTDNEKALQLIDEAITEARRIEGSDPFLPRALLAVANALREIEPARAWDATFDAVKAANSAEGFTGEDGMIVLRFEMKSQRSIHSSDVADFNVEGIFKQLATEDYDRAVELARGFQGEGPRAVATIAIARAVLEPKPKAK